MKNTFILLTLALTLTVNAQDDKIINLTVSGQGKTQDGAKQNALRSAIEQAFGAFISSKTEILNDVLIKDEIISVVNGNIQRYETLSEVKLPDGDYATTLKATVSVSKLTSFCANKGLAVEIKGASFAMNIKLQKLNEDAEYKAIVNLCNVSKEILSKSLDYELMVSEPVSLDGGSSAYKLKFDVTCKPNKNLDLFYDYFWKTLTNVAMTKPERENYRNVKKNMYDVLKFSGQGNNIALDTISLRNIKSLVALKNLFIKSNDILFDFHIISDLDTILVKKCCEEKVSREGENPVVTSNLSKWKLSGGFPDAAWYTPGQDYGRLYLWSKRLRSTWDIYFDFINKFRNHNALFSDSTYFTSNGESLTRDGEATYLPHEYLTWLQSNKYASELIIYAQPMQNKYIQEYSHTLSLEKLEKITGYKIEPFKNISASCKTCKTETLQKVNKFVKDFYASLIPMNTEGLTEDEIAAAYKKGGESHSNWKSFLATNIPFSQKQTYSEQKITNLTTDNHSHYSIKLKEILATDFNGNQAYVKVNIEYYIYETGTFFNEEIIRVNLADNKITGWYDVKPTLIEKLEYDGNENLTGEDLYRILGSNKE